MEPMFNHQGMTDDELLDELEAAVKGERTSLIRTLSCLGEVDHRSLPEGRGYPSLYIYCVKKLRLTDDEAYRRIHAARAARRHPAIFSYLSEGLLSLSGVSMLAPHLTQENSAELLAKAQGRSLRELRFLLVSLGVRSSGQQIAYEFGGRSTEHQKITPCAPRRARVAFDCTETLVWKLERAREVLRHKYPTGRYSDIFEEALESLLDSKDPERRIARKERRTAAKTGSPDASTQPKSSMGDSQRVPGKKTAAPGTPQRSVPQSVKDQVWKRDGGRCAFVGPDGTRCDERGGLEFDHIRPWAAGGASDDPKNIRLLCRAHNQLAAKTAFGEDTVEIAIEERTLRDSITRPP